MTKRERNRQLERKQVAYTPCSHSPIPPLPPEISPFGAPDTQVQVGFLYRANSPDGISITVEMSRSEFETRRRTSEESFGRAMSAAGFDMATEIKHMHEQCSSMAKSFQSTGNLGIQEASVLMANVFVMLKYGIIPDDEYNGILLVENCAAA